MIHIGSCRKMVFFGGMGGVGVHPHPVTLLSPSPSC